MQLRELNKTDIKLIFDWANNDAVRQNAFNEEKIIWEKHKKWFLNKLSDSDSLILILEDEGHPVGQIRFDKIEEYYEVDYSIDSKFRGMGYGYKMVCLGIQKLNQKKGNSVLIKAKVKESNTASQRVFKKRAFIELGQEVYNGVKYLVYTLKTETKTFVILSSKKWNEKTLLSLKNDFPFHKWVAITNKEDFTLEQLEGINPSVIFIPHWSYIIPEKIFSRFNCIVFHMTDLPYGRGGSPLQNLILRNQKKTKISALKVVKELDAGDIYLKKALSLIGTAEEIFIRASSLIEIMIFEIIVYNLEPKPQEGEIILFKRRTPEMSKIDNKIQEIEKLYDYIRMLDAEGYPKAYFETDFFKLEFTRASLKADQTVIADVRIFKK